MNPLGDVGNLCNFSVQRDQRAIPRTEVPSPGEVWDPLGDVVSFVSLLGIPGRPAIGVVLAGSPSCGIGGPSLDSDRWPGQTA